MLKDREYELVEECKNGDRQAMGTLVRQYERPIYNAAYRMLGNPDDAADATQTTFIKAFEHLDRFDARYKFFSWIYRIALNESINQLKKRKRFEELSDNQTATDAKPDELAASRQASKGVQGVLMSLHSDHRSVIALHYFSECSYQQIAEILQIPEKTVKSRLFTARQQMKIKLEELGILSG